MGFYGSFAGWRVKYFTGILAASLMGCVHAQSPQSGSDIAALDETQSGSDKKAPTAPQPRSDKKAPAAPRLDVRAVRTISANQGTYEAWPTLARTRDGELLIVYSGGREGHICPFGRVEMIRSSDDGKTWSLPEILIDTLLDDRDAGVLETGRGTWIVTWFTSTAWVGYFDKAVATGSDPEVWTPQKLARWQKAKESMVPENALFPEVKKTMEEHLRESGSVGIQQWMIRSEDRGFTWSAPYRVPLMSPHGPVLTEDGRLLLAGKKGSMIAMAESMDDGKTWEIIGKIPPSPGHGPDQYHELHMVEASKSRLVVQIRNHNKQNHYETLQSESHDGGKIWSPAHAIGVWGFPTHLLRMSDGRLMMTYSYRGVLRVPEKTNQILVRISEDAGESWSEASVVAGDLPHPDFGYPSSVELEDGSFLTVWYQYTPPQGKAEHWLNRHAQLKQAQFERIDDRCSTAYWYQTLPMQPFPPFPDRALRSAFLSDTNSVQDADEKTVAGDGVPSE